jgi:hypothetical protein
MTEAGGLRRKLIVLTEHRDTLKYLSAKCTYLGRPEVVVAIHGGVIPEERRVIQERFTQDKDCLILVATDAAGEGYQPAACAPAGQLRPALEPEPDRAAVRDVCTASARPRSATCGTWSPTRPVRARSTADCSTSCRRCETAWQMALALSASYLLAERQCHVRVCSQLRPSRSRPD